MSMVDDETSRILAEHSPEKWRQYALQEAQGDYRRAQKAARAAYVAAGGSEEALASCTDQRGEPLYDALVSAVQVAAAEYSRTCGEIRAEFARVTA
jgi:hypothetical protein